MCSESRDRVTFAREAAGEQDPWPVVVEVAEAAAGSLHLLDQEVRCLDGAVARSRGVVSEDLAPLPPERLRESSEFGA